MFGGWCDRAQGGGGEADGLYSDVALREEARRRKEEKDALLTLPNVAKLPPDMWSNVMAEVGRLARIEPDGDQMGSDELS